MSKKHPRECCRCGYCCLSESCEGATFYFGIERYQRCPALVFSGNIASCIISSMIPGIGEGCCIRARAIRDGITYDFAALPASLKVMCAKQFRQRLSAGKVGTK